MDVEPTPEEVQQYVTESSTLIAYDNSWRRASGCFDERGWRLAYQYPTHLGTSLRYHRATDRLLGGRTHQSDRPPTPQHARLRILHLAPQP